MPASRTLSIGDEFRDADVADALGVAFAGVAWGYATPAALQARSRLPLLERMDDILRLVRDDGVANDTSGAIPAPRSPAA